MLIVAGGLLGCAVDYPTYLEDGFFRCESSADCGPRWACAEGNVYSDDFCRPACDPNNASTCPGGLCTAAGACLQGCTIESDGSASLCDGDQFTCVRIDADRDFGVCYPVRGCSQTADCEFEGEPDQICLNDALGLPTEAGRGGFQFDHLYCSGAVDGEGRCPGGYLKVSIPSDNGLLDACYAPCELDGDGPRCPPATTCFAAFGEQAGTPQTPPCMPGVWGLPCEDDSHCLVGRCLPIDGERRACTELCEDAPEAGGCRALEGLTSVFGAGTRMNCESVAGVRTCVPRSELLALCSDQLDCVGDDTECRFVESGTVRAHLCIRSCSSPSDCAAGIASASDAEYQCQTIAGGSGICFARRKTGARCRIDSDCLEGSCCPLGPFSACQLRCAER